MMSSLPPGDPDTPCPPDRRHGALAQSQQPTSASHHGPAGHTGPPPFQQPEITTGNVASSPPTHRGGISASYSCPSNLSPSRTQGSKQPYAFQIVAQSSADDLYGNLLSHFPLGGFYPEQQQTNFVAPNTQVFDPHITHSDPFPPAAFLPPFSTRSLPEPGSFGDGALTSPRGGAPERSLDNSMQDRRRMSRVSDPRHQARPTQEIDGPPGFNSQTTPVIKREPEDDSAGGSSVTPQPLRDAWNNFMWIAPEARIIATTNPGSTNQLPPHPPATQGPFLNIAQRRFQSSAAARQYLERVHWRPITKSHGVPQTEDERLPYVKKIYDAFINISKVNDGDVFILDKQRFDARSGVWGTDPASIEAIAHEVVDTCIHIHNHGVTGLPLRRFPDIQLSDNHLDRSWTFAQRIHLIAALIARFKFCANHVMQSFFTMQYLARPWSTLMDQPYFAHIWKTSSPEAQNIFYTVQPYENVPAEHPTQAEVAQFRQEWQQEVQQRNQRIMQARQQLQQRQQQASSPSLTAAERAQQKVLEREAKRRKLNDSTSQAVSQPQAAENSAREQSSIRNTAQDDGGIPTLEAETDWEQIFRENEDHDLNVEDIEALFSTTKDDDGSDAKIAEGEDVVDEESKDAERQQIEGKEEGAQTNREHMVDADEEGREDEAEMGSRECSGGAGDSVAS